MEAIECILTRRSVREYKEKPVAIELIKKLIQCGNAAPSAGNEHPFRFKINKNREQLVSTNSVWLGNNEPLWHAYSAILVSYDNCALNNKYQWAYFQQDCSAAVENILLAAHSLDLGACWVGLDPNNESILKFISELWYETQEEKSNFIPFAIITIGYKLD